MQLYSYRHTERGARNRLEAIKAEERRVIQQAERAKYEAELERQNHLQEVRREAAARAASFREQMRLLNNRHIPAFADLERRTMRLFKVNRSELYSNRRHVQIVLARQFLMYWANRLTNLSLPQIGRLMGGRDHTTVLHGRDAYAAKRAKMGRYLRNAR